MLLRTFLLRQSLVAEHFLQVPISAVLSDDVDVILGFDQVDELHDVHMAEALQDLTLFW